MLSVFDVTTMHYISSIIQIDQKVFELTITCIYNRIFEATAQSTIIAHRLPTTWCIFYAFITIKSQRDEKFPNMEVTEETKVTTDRED